MELGELYGYIVKAYEDLGIRSFPVDCFDALHKAGLRAVKYSELSWKKQCACIHLSGSAFTLGNVLFYEDMDTPDSIRFSLAHELGHTILKTEDEDLADLFASHFLAPRILIHGIHGRNYKIIRDQFGISEQMSWRIYQDYTNWFRTIAYSRRRRPTDAELLLEEKFPPGSLRLPGGRDDAGDGGAADGTARGRAAGTGTGTASEDGTSGDASAPEAPVPRRRSRSRRMRRLQERSEFLDLMESQSPGFRFRRAEHQHFYGRDL